MKKLIGILLFIIFSKGLIAQSVLYSDRGVSALWNEYTNGWEVINKLADSSSIFILSKNRLLLQVYKEGNKAHIYFKELIDSRTAEFSDTAFYRINSTITVTKDIDGNSTYSFSTRDGLYNRIKEWEYENKNNTISYKTIVNDKLYMIMYHIKKGTIK